MNCLWPAASRFACLTSRTTLQSGLNLDKLAARLAYRQLCPFSKCSFQLQWKEVDALRPRFVRRIHHTSNASAKVNYPNRNSPAQRIITKYNLLPPTYEDEEGIQFRANPLSQDEVRGIFGDGIDANSANLVLSVLHGRRVAGTLEDPTFVNRMSTFEDRIQRIALSWLRKNVPVDEMDSAVKRAEQELLEMEAEIIADSERIGLYKPNSGDFGGIGKSVYGESGLDAIRAAKERELDGVGKRESPISQADEIRHNTGTLQKFSPRSRVELRRPGENPKLKYYMERAKVLPNTPPDMTKFQRLWPSALVMLSVIALSIAFTQVYKPPRNSARLWPDMPPAAATIAAVFLMNSFIFVAWRVPPLLRILNKYFITVPGYPFPLSVLGNIFSHQALSHYAINMIVLWFVGVRLHDEVGRANFLAIYFSCGVVGSFTSLASWVFRNSFVSSSLGASGALAGIIATYLWLNSDQSVKFLGFLLPEGIPGIPAALVLAGLIGCDIFFLTKWNKAPVTLDHWAHLGGYATGIGAAEILKVRARQRKIIEMERRKNLGLIDRIKEGRL